MAIGPRHTGPLPPSGPRSALKPILRQPLGPVVKEPEPATADEVVAFFGTHGHHPLGKLTIDAGELRLTAGEAELWTRVDAFDEALQSGKIAGDLPLVRGLLLFEMMHNVQLPGVIIDSLLDRFRQRATAGDGEAAYHDTVLQVVCACSVETYANCSAGMSRDLLQVSRFTQDAKQGLALGGMLSVFKKKENDLKLKVIEVHQYALTETLNQFMQSLADARGTGDYAKAFDMQKRFFEISAKITETDYWRKRAKTRGLDLAEELDAHAVGQTRADATNFADAVSMGMAAAAAAPEDDAS